MPAPERPKLHEAPELRDRLTDYIAARDCLDKQIARKIIQAMDPHELTLLELQARQGRPKRWNPKLEAPPMPAPIVEGAD